MPEETMKAVAPFIAVNESAIGKLRKAAAIKESRYPISLSLGFGMSFPNHLTKNRQAVRILSIDALYRTQQHDFAGATDSLKAAFGVAHSVAREPLTWSQANRNMCNEVSLDALSRALSLAQFSDKELSEIAAALQGEEDGRDETAMRMWECERCMMLDYFRHPDSVGAMIGTPTTSGLASLLYKGSGALAADRATYLKMVRDIMAAYRQPFPQRLATVKSVTASVGASAIRVLSHQMTAYYRDTCERDAEAIALLHAARTGVSVERYRLAKGMLPEKLDDLAPQFMDAVPDDPFDGKPLRYAKREKGYVVYSIGPNMEDDHGTERNPEPTADSPSDVTFVVER
jgi:hypothetical protein